ncbi:MAG: CoA-binding protein [Deltaproteobacteria bacterium]|nr:CoA-binding protein [Deltaproteobacteria bacterium]
MKRKSKEVIEKFTPLFKPRSVAFLGASKDRRKWGFITLKNMVSGNYPGKIYPVNPKEEEILGLKVYKGVGDIPETPDLAVIVVPPPNVVPVVKDCVARGIKAGIIITAGFAELGDQGGKLQEEMVAAAREGGMILVGPNCNGIMHPWEKLHIQFPPFLPTAGNIALVAQSGNVVDVLARQIMLRGFGCSILASTGNEADLHCEDYIEYLGEDPNTKVILSYVEGFKDGDRFFRVVREVSRKKPVVMLKAGKTSAGARAAMSHTASIAGSDAVFDAICRQTGVIRTEDLNEMLDIGVAFLRQPLPRGRGVGIVTAGGGWGVLAADACAEQGFDLVALPEETIAELDSFLPAWWNRGNPVDLVAGAFGEAIFKCVELILRCSDVDAAVVTSIMPALGSDWLTANEEPGESERLDKYMIQAVVDVMNRFNGLADRYQKPVIAASELMFGDAGREARIVQAMGQNKASCYHMPRQAAAVLAALARYSEYLQSRG